MWNARGNTSVIKKGGGNGLIAVAIDKDKGSQHALKWAVENLLARGQTVLLIHVLNRSPSCNVTQSPSLSFSLFLQTRINYQYICFWMQLMMNSTRLHCINSIWRR